MFSIKRKSGTVRKSECPVDLPDTKTFLDVPFIGSVCLVDDFEKVIVTQAMCYPYLYNYKIKAYPESHHI